MLPGYDAAGAIVNLYRYVKDRRSGKSMLLATPSLHHGVHGVNLFDPKCETIYVCEGPWDAMAWWEVLGSTRATEDGYAPTSNPDACLLTTASVIAVPGANAVPEHVLALCAGKRVVVMFDSDHPTKRCDKCQKTYSVASSESCPTCEDRNEHVKVSPPVGWEGSKRLTGKLSHYEQPPESVHVLQWGSDGYDSALRGGYDVRDRLKDEGDVFSARVTALKSLIDLVVPIPEDWVPGRSSSTAKGGGTSIDPLTCREWRTLVNSWRKAMKWPESGIGLDHALACMLASVTSTKAVGDQLWMKIIGPAACGKSTLCEAVSVAKKYVLPKSTIRGFHSGFGNHQDEDNSLLSQVRDKTLVTKDGDTLMQSPNLPQILSEARDVYDRTSRTHYRNKMSKDYEGVNMTWLLCGTSSLKSIDSSELGERFLDCVIMEAIDDDTEDAILDRVAEKADRAMSYEADGAVETQYDPSLLEAMRLTGGYVCHLRENAQSLLHGVECGPEAKDRLKMLAKFVSYMRARPSLKQDEQAEREFSARLLSQLLRLGKCLAAVLNRKTVDDEVMTRVSRVARDTARGRTLEIARVLRETGEDGMETQSITSLTHYGLEKTKALLRFLRSIGAAEWYHPKTTKGTISSAIRWRLTPRLRSIFDQVGD